MKNHYFLSQPHQPFFILAFTNALLSMLIFMLLFKGIITAQISAGEYHAYSLIFLLFTPAFLAFLFTTFPRFSGTPPIPQKHFLGIFWIFLAGSLLMLLGLFLSKIVVTMGMVLIFIAQLGAGNVLLSVYNASPMYPKEKTDQYWILIAVALGIVANLFFILSLWLPSLHAIAVQMAIYLYLFLLTFTVAQRMIPFFSGKPIEKHMERFKVVIGLLALHVLLETIQPHSSFLTDFVLAYLTGKEISRWRLPFPHPDPMIWILHVALFWIPVAFFFSGLSNILTLIDGTNFLFLDLHIIVLGFIFTILIGFGTRVTQGHSGNEIKSDRWVLLLFYWTQVVVVMRILTSLAVSSGWDFFIFFDISITVWLVMFGLWARRFFGMLIFKKQPTQTPPTEKPTEMKFGSKPTNINFGQKPMGMKFSAKKE
jgi:uncharacterized protein involved in response to NO